MDPSVMDYGWCDDNASQMNLFSPYAGFVEGEMEETIMPDTEWATDASAWLDASDHGVSLYKGHEMQAQLAEDVLGTKSSNFAPNGGQVEGPDNVAFEFWTSKERQRQRSSSRSH